MFLKDVSNDHQGCIYLVENTVNSDIVKRDQVSMISWFLGLDPSHVSGFVSTILQLRKVVKNNCSSNIMSAPLLKKSH